LWTGEQRVRRPTRHLDQFVGHLGLGLRFFLLETWSRWTGECYLKSKDMKRREECVDREIPLVELRVLLNKFAKVTLAGGTEEGMPSPSSPTLSWLILAESRNTSRTIKMAFEDVYPGKIRVAKARDRIRS